MDGYVVTETHAEAIAAFDEESVRHVALLENGEGLVAFDGDRPCVGALMVAADPFLIFDKVKKRSPFGGDGIEAFYLVTPVHAYAIRDRITAATVLTSGNVLVETDGADVPGAIWGSMATSWLDNRVPVA
jgi:hypothetical protein